MDAKTVAVETLLTLYQRCPASSHLETTAAGAATLLVAALLPRRFPGIPINPAGNISVQAYHAQTFDRAPLQGSYRRTQAGHDKIFRWWLPMGLPL